MENKYLKPQKAVFLDNAEPFFGPSYPFSKKYCEKYFIITYFAILLFDPQGST